MFIIQVQFFDLEKTYFSGQALRWKRIDDNKYVILNEEDAILISQNKDKIIIDDTEEHFFSKWYRYLSFDIPYDKIYYSFVNMHNEAMNNILLKCTDIHIIRKSIFELLVTCILSYRTERRTRQVLNDIAEICGRKSISNARGLGKFTWYIFPSPQELVSKVNLVTSIDIKRKKLLENISQNIIDGNISLEDLSLATNKFSVNDILCDYLPVTIIKKVCLGLGILDAFPMTKSTKLLLEKKELDVNIFKNSNYRGFVYCMLNRVGQYPILKTDYGDLYEYSRADKKRRTRKRRKDTII